MGHNEVMRASTSQMTWKMALWVVLTGATLWGAPAAMIAYSVRHLSTTHGCLVWIPVDYTGLLLAMGGRSVPALRQGINDPGVGMNSKIHLAWIACQVGDTSQFPVLVSGLASKRHRCIATVRMLDFPQECLRHLPEILAAGRQKQDLHYADLLIRLARYANVSENAMDRLADIVYGEGFEQGKGLTHQEIQQITQLFQARFPQAHSRQVRPLTLSKR